MPKITLSLVSHTNVGKTTLARTLLREDVGEVRDEAHVTDASAGYTFLQVAGDELRIWDTPGFGDSARLLARLRRQGDPLGWFLGRVWDRWANRSLYCSQLAVRNVRDEADLVIYLVDARERPEDAGYVAAELEILAWTGRPVVALLNHVDPDLDTGAGAWRRFLAGHAVVRETLVLDAFTCSWTEENRLFHRLAAHLEGEKAAAMTRLAEALEGRQRAVFLEACAALGGFAAKIATLREPLPAASMARLMGPLAREAPPRAARRLHRAAAAALEDTTRRLLAMHRLDGEGRQRIRRDLQALGRIRGPLVDEVSGGFWGTLLGALGTGLTADVLSGGLSLGGGLLAGGLVGLATGVAAGRGARSLTGIDGAELVVAPAARLALCREAALLYLMVSHHGRGRGPFTEPSPPAFLASVLEEIWPEHEARFRRMLRRAPAESAEGFAAVFRDLLEAALDTAARRREAGWAFPGAGGAEDRPVRG